MLRETGPRIPPLLAVMRDVMLADLDTSLGRPHAALKLLRSYRGGELAILAAMPSARAHLALSDLRSAQDCVRTVLTTPSTQTGRFVLVEELAAMVAWLASEDCAFSTGAVFDISGGRATY